MKYTAAILVAIVLAMAPSSQSQQEPAQMTLSVFYETLCPDSIRFITRQLFPTFNSLGALGNPFLEIDFVPYGKANTTAVNDTYTFICQHGDEECEGNKMHACALDIYPKWAKAPFINCTMGSGNPPRAGPACAEELWLDWPSVQECWDSPRGPALLAANGNRTHSLEPALYYVPWILYDGVFSVEDLDASQVNLLSVVCSKLQSGTEPSICNEHRKP